MFSNLIFLVLITAVIKQAIVLLVGTNNHGHTPDMIAEGIVAIVHLMREKQPQANIVVLVQYRNILYSIFLPFFFILFKNKNRSNSLKLIRLMISIPISLFYCSRYFHAVTL